MKNLDKLKHTYENKILTLKIIGDIDHHTAKGVREYADSLIIEKRPRLILFDLSSVEFMDSSGLGLILGRFTLASDLGCEFMLYKPAPSVSRILSLAGIERLMKIEGENKNEA